MKHMQQVEHNVKHIQTNTKTAATGCIIIARLLVFIWCVNVSSQRYSRLVKFVFVALLIHYSH